jgi:hypothetical protein
VIILFAPHTDLRCLKAFISGLGPGFIGAPSTSGLLTTNDIWGYYMSVPFMKTDVTITSTESTATPKVTSISSISMVCRLFGDTNSLAFSTANNEAQFNTSNPDQDYNAVGATISNSNVTIPDTGVVVCGLDPAATLTGVKFEDLMTTFNFAPKDDNSTLWKMITFLENDAGVALNLALLAADTDTDITTKEVYRNAIWCFADVCNLARCPKSHKTNTRFYHRHCFASRSDYHLLSIRESKTSISPALPTI